MSETSPTGGILIVDDNPANLDLLSGILRDKSLRVRAATGGQRAIATARTCLPELVMLDVNMPGMNGYEVCRELKADSATRDIPVIFISALSEPMDKVRAFEVGGIDYVTKPFDAAEVLARVTTQLQLARMRRELAERNRELQQANELKNRFLGMAAHDLRSPLVLVLGYAELLLDDPALGESRRPFVDSIRETAGFMRRLVDDLLDISAIEAGQLRLESRAFDLVPLVAASVGRAAPLAARKDVPVGFDPPPGPLLVMADEARVREVLENLIGNALKYSPRGQPVEVRLAAEPGAARVTVADRGPGIPADEVARLFEPFQKASVKPTGGEKSTGLGLAIARKIVTEHGGRIWAESEVGRGTSFHFTLAGVEP